MVGLTTFVGGIWKILRPWTRKSVENFKWGLMDNTMGDSGSESSICYECPAQEVSEGMNISK